jgi:hypothetical protein
MHTFPAAGNLPEVDICSCEQRARERVRERERGKERLTVPEEEHRSLPVAGCPFIRSTKQERKIEKQYAVAA